MSDESIDPDRVAPTPSQVTPALHMLALSVPLMSALYGACLRQALSYHQLFHRLDPFLFRLLVGILLVLVSGQVACITAETWYILTTVINGKEDLQAQRIINACTQVSTTATALLCQGFYTERLFATSRNVIVRSLAIFFWMLAISLFIAWNVKYLLHNGPHLNGDRKYNLGAASLWALALASSFVSICLIHYAHQRRLRSSKSTPILPLSSRLFQLLSLSIQTFLLLTLNQIASAIGFTSSLSTSSNATAACVAFFFFNLFPGLSVFSIIYTLNQRSLELVKKKKYARSGKRRCSLNQRDEKKGKREMVMREKEREGEEIGTGCTAPEDDPSNWRGDHLPTSRTGSVSGAARDGLGVFDPVVGLSACGFGGPSRGGGGKRTELEEEEGDLENGIPAFLANPSNTISPSSSTSLPPPVIANLDNFDPSYSSSDSDSDSTPPPSPPLGPTQLTSLPFSSEPFDDTEIFTSGSIPFPPSHVPRRSVDREARNRGASVQIDEVGYGMNWDALEGCQEARIGPDMSRRGSRV